MKHLFGVSTRTRRLFTIISVSLIFCLLVVIDASETYSYVKASSAVWLHFSGSLLMALMFLVVGSLVLYYARDRLAANLLYSFCCMMMFVFNVQTGAVVGDTLLIMLGNIATILAIPTLFTLLCSFPRNYFELLWQKLVQGNIVPSCWLKGKFWYVPVYAFVLVCCSLVLVILFLYFFFLAREQATWLSTVTYSYAGIGLASAIFIAVFTYVRSPSPRARQQSSIFIGGTLVAIIPVLFLTIFPALLTSLTLPVVNPQLSTLSFIVFPLSLGYSILRYQILVFDVYIRQASLWVFNVISLCVLEYIILTVISHLWLVNPTLYIITCAILTALLTPVLFCLTNLWSDKLFFNEVTRYHRFTANARNLADTTLNLREVALLITTTLMQTFETTAICLFVLEEEHGCYCICPEIATNSGDLARHALLEYMLSKFGMENVSAYGNGFSLQHPLIAHIALARRPLLLYELLALEQEKSKRLHQ